MPVSAAATNAATINAKNNSTKTNTKNTKTSPAKNVAANAPQKNASRPNAAPKNAVRPNASTKNVSPPRNAAQFVRTPESEAVFNCKNKVKEGVMESCVKDPGCKVIKECGKFGVGSADWPVGKGADWDKIKSVMTTPERKGDFKEGKNCVRRTLYDNYPEYGKCNDLDPSYKKANAGKKNAATNASANKNAANTGKKNATTNASANKKNASNAGNAGNSGNSGGKKNTTKNASAMKTLFGL